MSPLPVTSPLLAAVRKARSERDKILAEIEQLEAAPVTDADLRARIAAEIEDAVQQLREVAAAGQLRMPGRADRVLLTGQRGASSLALLALLRVPAVAEALASEALAANGAAAGLPAAERAAKAAKLRARLAEIETSEEIEIIKLEAAGHTVQRRDDVDPQILVELWSRPAESAA